MIPNVNNRLILVAGECPGSLAGGVKKALAIAP
jgi:hypothetical protein